MTIVTSAAEHGEPMRPGNGPRQALAGHLMQLAPLGVILALLAVWELACRLFAIPQFVLPAPSAIWQSAESFGLSNWTSNFLATLEIVLIGFAVSIVVSIPLAIILTHNRILARTVYPILVIIQSTPIVAVAPIIVVMLGTGVLPRIVIVFLITFFPLVISTATGLAATPKELIELSRSLKAGTRREYLHIRLPYAVPFIFSALRISVTLAVIGSVVAEFVAADKGLGFLILFSTSMFKVPQAFASLTILVTASLVLFQVVILVQSLLFSWSLPKSDRDDG
jgi:NitT/TauT family transport system permease protein